ncbi:hypothetical protein [Pimelobacter simplex]|uniref:hypothetical protein n=1 Tax=Nocardioides simplex TaxID=2045 RepID=UPI001931FBC8|nr:hypothetical protein [Pimelobacter simplex]
MTTAIDQDVSDRLAKKEAAETRGGDVRSEDNLADRLAGDAFGTLVPGANAIGEQVAGLVRREWARLTSRALTVAEVRSGLTREEFADWVEAEPQAVPLYMKVLWAAGMNGHDATLRAMGAVLGEAANATARKDEEGFARAELALQAMTDLGPLHFRVLAVLADSVVVTQQDGDNFGQFVANYVATKAAMSEVVVEHCLLNLANSGLTTLTSVFGANAYPLTDLGRAVLRAVEEVV